MWATQQRMPVAWQSFLFLNRRMWQWGRRILRWPRGSPTAAVAGELGWQPVHCLALARAAGLLARLAAVPSDAHRRALAVFRYAARHRHSWAAGVLSLLHDMGVGPLGLHVAPGCSAAARPWQTTQVRPAIRRASLEWYQEEALRIASLSSYVAYQPAPM